MSKQFIYQEKFTVQMEKNVQVIRVIRTTLERRGDGTDGDPIRRITQYWNFDGELLWEHDPYQAKKKKAKKIK